MQNILGLQEPKLVYEDEQLFDSMLKDSLRLFPHIQKLKESWEQTKLGPFDDKAYKKLISYGGVASVKSQALTEATKQYETLALHSETIRNEVLADASKRVQELEQSVKLLKTALQFGTYNFPLDVISIDEAGNPLITDEGKEALKNKYCRVYLHSTLEVTLYEKLHKIAEAVNEVWLELMEHKVSKSDLPYHGNYHQQLALLMHTLRVDNKGEVSVRSGMVPHLVSKYRQNRQD